MKKTVVNNNQNSEILGLAKYAGALVALLALLFGGLQWLDSRYVDQRLFVMYQQQTERERHSDNQKLVELFEAVETERERDLNLLYRAIRDASMTGLVVRRDILISRGRQNLTPEETAELEILELKLADMQLL